MRRLLVCLLMLSLSLAAYPQKSKDKLEKQIAALREEIATASKLLKQTSKDREMTLGQVSILDKKIKQREALVKAYGTQIAALDAEISKGQGNIKTLNAELAKLRKEYAQMIVFARRNQNRYDALAFLFASDDFNQAFRRMRYIRQFTEARKTKMDQIAATERRISGELEASRRARDEKAALLRDEREQHEALRDEKDDLGRQVASLKKREGQLQQDIKDKQQQAQKLQQAIDDIIAEEIRKANEKARLEAEKTAGNKPAGGNMALTPEEKMLSADFAGNRGKLPWPVERGIVSSSFGKHESVVSSKVVVTNNGIDIAVDENSQARAVFDGTVVSVNKLSGSNTVIIIRHGDYFTVYSNIETPAVKRGDEVKTKQRLGLIHTNKMEERTELHFEILKERERMNPELWLAR